jgi:hypothetical protein
MTTNENDITALKGTVGGHTTTLGSHTTTLGSHTTSISDLNGAVGTKLAKSANLSDVSDKAAALHNIGAQAALAYAPMNAAGGQFGGSIGVSGNINAAGDVYSGRSNGSGYFFCNNLAADRYYGHDGSNFVVNGPGWLYNNGYVTYNAATLGGVVTGCRLVYAGDFATGGITEVGGAVVTACWISNGEWGPVAAVRMRYLQVYINTIGWATAGFA